MTSPAERYAAASQRAVHPALVDFAGLYPFPLDPFQREACEALEEGYGVLVCAPTGAGKTVVGEFAVHLALRVGRKCFYTTPIKALSNQKFNDLVARYGAGNVGLLTGDNAINGSAPIVVMTTEVLRNMLYAGSSTVDGLGFVVMDEVHYLADRYRGAVWEEVIIHLPASVTLVSLSATVSNAEEFAEWLVTVRGDTKVIVTEHRPVPLWQHMLVGKRMFDLFKDGEHAVDPDLVRYVREQDRYAAPASRRDNGGRPRTWRPPPRVDVIERLDRDGLLPAITFIFSRAGCQDAVAQCVRSGLRLNTLEERHEIRRIVEARTADLAAEDLRVLGYWEWLEALERGVAAHHAGMVPTFKETVEELFGRGLVKAVFATETLALGINMPARSVVLEKLAKWNGEQHADMTPGEYTQLTGRAGRRGIDIEGHAVVVWAPGMDPRHVAGLATTRTYPLRSSFRPSYNMAVNLVGRLGRAESRVLLESSFAQFQADASVVGLVRQIQRNTEALVGYAEAAGCHLGDFMEYAGLRAVLKGREVALAREGAVLRRAAAAGSLERLKVGDVIRVPSGRRAGLAVVLDPGVHPMTDPRPLVLTEDRWAGRLSVADFPSPVEPLARVRVAKNFNHRVPAERRDLAATLRNALAGLADDGSGRRGRSRAADDAEIARLRAEIRRHPCHGCADREEHARWAERYLRLERDTGGLRRRVENATHSISRTFDRVCALLEERGYLAGDEVTPAGSRLARIWSESDLLVAECLRAGVWDGLSAPELAAAVSALVYESRRDAEGVPRLPVGAVRDALGQTTRLWAELEGQEREHRLTLTREPDLGFAWPAYRWAWGEPLDRVLAASEPGGAELSAGDFVRWCKQLVDLLDQVGKAAADSPLRETARAAVDAVRRGVVAYTGVA
ncbi:MAG TPA: DEAD/DEAH box helicase [Mycobacteriales bacterium]|nr:DEAD/DEAH box helicase [Mycobacteriales bacterium]